MQCDILKKLKLFLTAFFKLKICFLLLKILVFKKNYKVLVLDMLKFSR